MTEKVIQRRILTVDHDQSYDDEKPYQLNMTQNSLSTSSLVIPSCHSDSIIFQENFLQLKGVLLTHPSLS